MSKRLKRKIRELCNLDEMSKEERLIRAKEILNSTKEKQKLCNSMPGLTFRDIEKAMVAIMEERQPSAKELEELEERSLHPEKYEPQSISPSTGKPGEYRSLTREEVARLIAASKEPCINVAPSTWTDDYPTYSAEEVAALMKGNYNPNMFKYIKKYKKT